MNFPRLIVITSIFTMLHINMSAQNILLDELKDFTIVFYKTEIINDEIHLSWASHDDNPFLSYYALAPYDANYSALFQDTTYTINTNEIIAGNTLVLRKGGGEIWSSAQTFVTYGIEMNHDEYKGKILVLVADDLYDGLNMELQQLRYDLIGDGWLPYFERVDASYGVSDVKSLVSTYYTSHGINSLYIIGGSIPIPRSGEIAGDSHPEHHGAWAADTYYADMDGIWTDSIVDVTLPLSQFNNVPGDGRFDQELTPSGLELEHGRINFDHLPVYSESELELTKRYLSKAHNYRIVSNTNYNDIVLGNPFWGVDLTFNESWHIFNNSNEKPEVIKIEDNYVDELKNGHFKFFESIGPGGPTQLIGKITSQDWAEDSLNVNIVNLAGSYFVNTLYENNLLRSSLASRSPTIAAMINGANRPPWFHSIGRTLGYCFKMGHDSLLWETFALQDSRSVTQFLMGDPSLKYESKRQISSMNLAQNGNKVELLWDDSGYESDVTFSIYRSVSLDSTFIKIGSNISGNKFDDLFPVSGNIYYMIRAVDLDTVPNGSFYNYSCGLIDSIQVDVVSIITQSRSTEINIYPNPAKNSVTIEGIDPRQHDIFVLSMNGKIIRKVDSAVVHLDRLPKGSYFIQVKDRQTNEVLSKKLIKI